jgi:hypothetical protein
MKFPRMILLALVLVLLSWSLTSAGSDRTIELTIDSTTALVDGGSVQLDVAPFIKDGRTFVPLRFVSEQLGALVTYTTKPDGSVDKVTVKMSASDSISPTPTPTPSSSLTPTPTTVLKRMEVDGVALSVLNVATATEHGMWVPEGDGNVFLDVEVKFENLAREETYSVNTLYFSVKDSNGNAYGHVMVGGLDPDLPLTHLAKGQSVSGYVSFVVPQSASGFTLVYAPFIGAGFELDLGS